MSKRHKIKPPTKEEHERIVRDGIRILLKNSEFQQKQETDIEQLILSAKAVVKRVNTHLNSIDQAVKAAGIDHDRLKLREEAQRMYLEGLCNYNKDELFLILVCFFTDLSVKEIVWMEVMWNERTMPRV